MEPGDEDADARHAPSLPSGQLPCEECANGGQAYTYLVAVLMTCHNRRPSTVASLRALFVAATRVPELELRVFLTDDGSTDGTGDAVRALGLPVDVIAGSGNLYWNRGTLRAWEAADASDRPFAGYLLLNDDTVLDPGSLQVLLAMSRHAGHRAIVVGAVRDTATGALAYGGVLLASRWHPGRIRRLQPSAATQHADTFNANCVLVPRLVRRRVGVLDGGFTHGIGDLDYGLRARRAGCEVLVAPGLVGECPRAGTDGSWEDRTLPLRRRLELLASPKGLPRKEWLRYLRRHGARAPWLLAWGPTLRVMATAAIPTVARRVSRTAP